MTLLKDKVSLDLKLEYDPKDFLVMFGDAKDNVWVYAKRCRGEIYIKKIRAINEYLQACGYKATVMLNHEFGTHSRVERL